MPKRWKVEATYTEPILAWRIWRVVNRQMLAAGRGPLRLASATQAGQPKFWEPRRPYEGVCSKVNSWHESPWPTCDCGIYGLRMPELAEAALDHYARGDLARGWVIGRVSLWGRIVECENGWRAQFAYPYELTVFTNSPAVAVCLRECYAVDVERRGVRRGQRMRSSEEAREAARIARRARAERHRQEAREQAVYEEWLERWRAVQGAKLVFTDEELVEALGKAITLIADRWSFGYAWSSDVAEVLADFRPLGATRGDVSIVGRRLTALARKGIIERVGTKWDPSRWRLRTTHRFAKAA